MSTRYLLPLLACFVLLLARCGGSSDLEIGTHGIGGNGAVSGSAGEAGEKNAAASGGMGAAGGSGQDAGAAGQSNTVTAGAPSEAAGGAAGESGTSQGTLLALEVTPSSARVAMGAQALLTATARYTDGTTADVTARATWSSSAPDVASVKAGTVSGVAAGTATISAVLDGTTGTALVTVPNATVASLAVTPATASVGVHGAVSFAAIATLSDGTIEDETATAVWSSSDVTIATVAGHVATGIAPGTTTISATAAGKSASGTLTVTSATLVAIDVTPANATLGVGASLVFQATGTFSDNTVADVTGSATWTSTVESVASIDATTHRAVGASAGTTSIVATIGSLSGEAELTVTEATLVGITVAPDTSTLAVNGTVQLGAVGAYSDGSTADLTGSVTWTSNSAGIASVSNATGSRGLVQGLSAGTATITATFDGVSGTASVTVTAAPLVSIELTPAAPTVPVATTLAFTATGVYGDGSRADVTQSASWASSKPSIATVGNANGSRGVLNALAAGATSITATLDGVQGATTVTVTAAALVSIAVTPSNLTLEPGGTRAMTATGTYSDNTTVDLTASAVWSSSDTGVATVSNASGSQGTLAAIDAGTTTVSATFAGVTGSTPVTVATPTLSQIVLEPIAASVPLGQTVRYTAIAIYSNNSQRDVTGQATWASSDSVVATVRRGNGGGPGGGGGATATTLAAGQTTISATYQGISGSTTLTVTSATVSQIVVTPLDPTLPVGRTQQLVATAIYSDDTSQNVTGQATWQSSATAVAQVSTGGGGPGPGGGGAGVVTAISAGSAVVTASWGGVSGTTTISVTKATIASITVNPATASLAVGAQQAFTAQAIYSDNTSADVTQAATWISSDATIAGVNDAGGPGANKGLAKALAAGTVTISAAYGGVTGTAALTVTSATLVAVELTPVAPSVAVGTSVQFAATALYSDNTSRTVTAEATWTSSNASIAEVSTAGGSRGLTQALASGNATINATYGGVKGATTIHVTSATLTSITVTPFEPTLLVGIPLRFTATGVYSDFTTADLTTAVTWTSSAQNVLALSNANGTRGQATPLTAGAATVSATYQGVTGDDAASVSSATISSIAVSPATATVTLHATQPFTALATLSDASTLDVTPYVTWLSSTSTTAAISNASGSQGIATGLALGSVTITAVRGSVSGTAQLTVE